MINKYNIEILYLIIELILLMKNIFKWHYIFVWIYINIDGILILYYFEYIYEEFFFFVISIYRYIFIVYLG